MKNLIKIITPLLIIIAFTQHSSAQEIGGGLSFFTHTGSSEIGINARGGFALNDNMEIAPHINYYFADGFTLFGINTDFHYLFGNEGSIRFYPLGGLNFMIAAVNGNSNSEFQFNLGGGTKYPINDNISLYGEGKFILGDFDGIVISAGVLFNIGS